MNRISRNVSIIFRSERLIAQRRFAVLRRQTGFMAAAGIVAGIGLIMLNAAAYLALSTKVSTPLAALIVAIGAMEVLEFWFTIKRQNHRINVIRHPPATLFAKCSVGCDY